MNPLFLSTHKPHSRQFAVHNLNEAYTGTYIYYNIHQSIIEYTPTKNRQNNSIVRLWLSSMTLWNKMHMFLVNDFQAENATIKQDFINFLILNVASWCLRVFFVLCVCFCTGHFVKLPLNLTCLHCLQYSFFEHFFN